MPHSVLSPHHSEPFLLGSAFGGNLPPLARHPRCSHSASLHNWHVACSGSRSVDRAETLTLPTGETCITTSYGASECGPSGESPTCAPRSTARLPPRPSLATAPRTCLTHSPSRRPTGRRKASRRGSCHSLMDSPLRTFSRAPALQSTSTPSCVAWPRLEGRRIIGPISSDIFGT